MGIFPRGMVNSPMPQTGRNKVSGLPCYEWKIRSYLLLAVPAIKRMRRTIREKTATGSKEETSE